MKKAGPLSILIAVMLLAVAVVAEAQQPKKIPRIGYLAASRSIRSLGAGSRISVGYAPARDSIIVSPPG